MCSEVVLLLLLGLRKLMMWLGVICMFIVLMILWLLKDLFRFWMLIVSLVIGRCLVVDWGVGVWYFWFLWVVF